MNLAALIRAHSPGPHTTDLRPYLVAEAGVNHEGSMEIARRLIDEAAASGADAVKFQTYRAETLASRDSPAYWDTSEEPTQSQYELFKRHDSFWKSEFEELKRHCDAAGVEFMSTPFDVESATFLADLQDVVKISSSDLTNLPFIDLICGFGMPVILSTGAAFLWEIEQAVQVIRDHGNPLCLMHCVLNYPARDEDANLAMIGDLAVRFPEALPGYSDHTHPNPDMDVLVTAAMLGARVLEKHFTHDKGLPGNDHYHSMDAADVAAFRRRLDRIALLAGSAAKRPLPSEEISRANARRSLVASRTIPAGGRIEGLDLTWKRPATGISPAEYWNVVGRTAAVEIVEDQVLQWNMLE